MDPRTREILQLDLIFEHIARRASSSLGREYVQSLTPAVELREIERRAAPMRDLLLVLESGASLPLGGLHDVRPQLEKARVPGSALEAEEWRPLERFLQIVADLAKFCGQHKDRWPALCRLMVDCEDHRELRDAVGHTFDPDGKIRDHASPELAAVRRRLRDAERDLQRTVNRLAGQLHADGVLQENYATVRGGRFVLPVKASSRGRVRGVIHGSSASGETYYIEPMEFIESSTEVEALHEEEQREIHRILLALTAQLRPLVGLLSANVGTVARLDGMQAIARAAVERGWHLPLVVEQGALRLFNAHHPLLSLETPQSSMPITMILDPQDRCLVLSGPNAGGKTTAMKMVAALSVLAQCGCPVPAFPDSTLPIFSNVLADIGDQQDLQQGISTFSGHIRRITELWRQAGHRTLVLLDELGTGTDPQEGVALALALLNGFVRRARLTFTTSHLNPVKQWAEDTDGARNASFSLDPGTHAPTFRLRLDIPGASEALEIAAREGLPREVLDAARAQVGQKHLEMGEMLRRIEDRERKLAAAVKDAEARAKSLAEQEEMVTARAELLRDERRQLKKKSIDERERAVAEVRERIERLIADLPGEEELARRREVLVRAREEALREQQLTAKERRRLAEEQAETGQIFTGQRVFVTDLHQWGQLLELDESRKRARVMVGGIEVATLADRLLDHDPRERREEQLRKSEEKIQGKLAPKKKKSRNIREALREAEEYSGPTKAGGVTYQGRGLTGITRPSSMTLDLHGYRVEEALAEIDVFLDRSILADYPYVKICHGTGTGRLYKAIHEYLRTHPVVKKFRFATSDEGGGGVTVVEL